jgi:hypothetical protein
VADAAVVGLRYPLDLGWEGAVWDAKGGGACLAEDDIVRLEEGGEGWPEVRLCQFGGRNVVFFWAGRKSGDRCGGSLRGLDLRRHRCEERFERCGGILCAFDCGGKGVQVDRILCQDFAREAARVCVGCQASNDENAVGLLNGGCHAES